MSKDYTKEIGYESLLSDFKRYQKQTPRGVGMTRKGQNIYLQFKTPNTARKPYACNCAFTLDGMVEALKKSKQVKEKLDNLVSETEFWNWYDKEVKNESQLVDDRITFGEAIAKVENDFWSRLDRRKQARSKTDASDLSSWHETYGKFYKWLDLNEEISLSQINHVINKWDKGTKTYRYAVSAMGKLAEMNKRRDICEELSQLDTTQTKFLELQRLDLNTFLTWRDEVLGISKELPVNAKLDSRIAWMWVFSVQIIYALRISEVFAIKNLFTDYVTPDKITIPALIKSSNTTNLIYIGDRTLIGTKVKTGNRLARPNIPPKYPDLLEILNIKNPSLPDIKPRSKNPNTIRHFYVKSARARLVKLNAPFTQTHVDRHLGNVNGIQAGIPLEVRAQSMGHTPAMNDSTYKKRQSTQTTIDLLLNSNTNAIDFVTALAEAKKLVTEDKSNKSVIAHLLSIIYQKDIKAINELL